MTYEELFFCNRSNLKITATVNKIPIKGLQPIIMYYCYEKSCPFRKDCEFGIDDGLRFGNVKYITPTLH